MNREEVVAELRRVAALLGKEGISRSEFKRHGRISSWLVEKTFGTWNKALEAAGLLATDRFKRIADSELEEEFHRVCTKLGKVPTRNEFAIESKFSPDVYEKRFQSWRGVVTHYLEPEAAGAPSRREDRGHVVQRVSATGEARTAAPPVDAGRRARRFGGPLNFRELRHEPTSELGVVYPFGMVAHELNFLVEAVGAEFPDCRAKRLAKGGYYVEVNIEFEFKSSNFREHGHDPAGCDLVVCWEHDWLDCPVEVLELKSAIRKLDADV